MVKKIDTELTAAHLKSCGLGYLDVAIHGRDYVEGRLYERSARIYEQEGDKASTICRYQMALLKFKTLRLFGDALRIANRMNDPELIKLYEKKVRTQRRSHNLKSRTQQVVTNGEEI